MSALQSWFRKYGLYSVVVVIGILLLVNIYLMYLNNTVIEHNKDQQEEAERIKVATVDILRNLHYFDMMARSTALVVKDRFINGLDTGVINNDTIFRSLEFALEKQRFPMTDFYSLRDSVDKYMQQIYSFKGELANQQVGRFVALLEKDPGFDVWLAYNEFSIHVNAFEDQIAREAKEKYQRALQYSYLLQLLLFLITIPTLAYTAYYTVQSLSISEKFRQSEEERSKLLATQNEQLEFKVRERTNEILAQNEEIASQNEQISAHNEKLRLQQQQIEQQRNTLIEQNEELRLAKRAVEEQHMYALEKNSELTDEVSSQTEDLRKANLALMEQNSRLQQFAYIISHNLRAPLARLVGLTNIFQHASDPKEAATIISMMVASANSIDEVIKDLAFILEIQRQNTQVLTSIEVDATITKVALMLETEIEATQATIVRQIQPGAKVKGLPQYVESIFYNLISNAIKYRDPFRKMEIVIRSSENEEFTIVEVADNGLGINLEKYNDKLFMIYKRFHSHVEGKGLGLYLVKTQVTAMGGKIEVSSRLDAGTTFTIYFKK